MAILTRLWVPGTAEQWRTLGFDIDGDRFCITHVEFVLGAERMEWGFDEIHGDPTAFGVPTNVAPATPLEPAPHPNHIDSIDHVVWSVPDLDEAIALAESALCLDLRRRAHPRGPSGPEMAFFKPGRLVLEVVKGNGFGLFGVAFSSPDLDKTVALMREREAPVGDPKPAVQGGLIASVWRGFTGMPIAIMQASRRPA